MNFLALAIAVMFGVTSSATLEVRRAFAAASTRQSSFIFGVSHGGWCVAMEQKLSELSKGDEEILVQNRLNVQI